MAASVKIPVLNRKIVFEGNGVFSPETRAAAFAEAARRSILEIDHTNDTVLGRDVSYKTFVDGMETGNLNSAKDTSVILARWDLTPGVIEHIDRLLASAGPVKTGAYRDSRVIYADGVEIDDPKKAAGAKEVMFMSLVPYARKIERGKKGYAPGHVYEAVAALAKSRFSNVGLIKFTYAQPEGASPALRRWAMQNAHGVGPAEWKPKKMSQSDADARKKRVQMIKNLRQPAILVYL